MADDIQIDFSSAPAEVAQHASKALGLWLGVYEAASFFGIRNGRGAKSMRSGSNGVPRGPAIGQEDRVLSSMVEALRCMAPEWSVDLLVTFFVGDFLAMRNMDCLSMSSLLSALISRAACAIITVSHKALSGGT